MSHARERFGTTPTGRVVSVNISKAKGERKRPVDSARLEAGLGLMGDAHAGDWHRQISLLALESIESMRNQGLDVGPGDFAENLTVAGIELPSLAVGTLVSAGGAMLQVTQIGKECHEPCDIFRQAGDCVMPREGIFARVVAGGDVAEGDRIDVQPRGSDSIDSGTAVLTISDSGYAGSRPDDSGELLAGLLESYGATAVTRMIVPDERERIAAALIELCDDGGVKLVLTSGGTGLAPRDVTPEATLSVIEREAPGFAEAIRAGTGKGNPRAMLSRAVSGIRGRTLIVNLPGSPRACAEAFAVIGPALAHGLEVLGGGCGECAR